MVGDFGCLRRSALSLQVQLGATAGLGKVQPSGCWTFFCLVFLKFMQSFEMLVRNGYGCVCVLSLGF